MITAPRLCRSVLYVPGSNPRAMAKAKSLPCDAVILDLEDAVAPDDKAQARENIVDALGAGGYGGRRVAVRINPLGSPWYEEDLEALGDVADCPPDAVVIPKAETSEQVQGVATALDHADVACGLWVMIETPRGVLCADQVAAASSRVELLLLGTNDLLADLRAQAGADRRALHTSMSRAVLVARAEGLEIVDGVFNHLKDSDGLARECAQGREWGFDGKSVIHPSQIATANEVFSPSAAEVSYAEGLIAAWQEAQAAGATGVATYQGALIELLHVRQSERILALAELARA